MNEQKRDALKEKFLGSLSAEQRTQAEACATAGEMMDLAGEWGVELPDEMLDAVAGGCNDYGDVSAEPGDPICGSCHYYKAQTGGVCWSCYYKYCS